MRYMTPINTEDRLPHQPPVIAANGGLEEPAFATFFDYEQAQEVTLHEVWWNAFNDETDKGASEETATKVANRAMQEFLANPDEEQDAPVKQHADALVFMIAASDGLEEPFFKTFFDYEQAQEVFEKWAEELCSEVGDRVDFLKVTKEGNTVTVKSAQFEESKSQYTDFLIKTL